MFSQVFILSSRGDVIIFRDYRNELPKDTHEVFFKKAITKLLRPFENINGINYISIQQGGLYFVCTIIQSNILPSMASSFLVHFVRVLKDYCGTINESSLRNNFVMVYEILDEILDFGFIQNCSTARLKPLLSKDTIAQTDLQLEDSFLADILKIKTKASAAASKPIAVSVDEDRSQKNEVYVDIIENLSVTFSTMGEPTRLDIIGKLVIKSYLKGNPEVQIGLSQNFGVRTRDEDLTSNREVFLDDISFDPCVKQDFFDRDRSIHFFPSDGETNILKYRIHESFSPPFKCVTSIEEVGNKMVDLLIKLNPVFPSDSSTSFISLSFNAPKGLESVSFSMTFPPEEDDEEEDEQTAIYRRQQQKIEWKIGKVYGGFEQILRVKFNFEQVPKIENILKEIGSILLDFELPMFLCSKLKIRYLRIMERSENYEPDRWVRYLSKSESYRFRL